MKRFSFYALVYFSAISDQCDYRVTVVSLWSGEDLAVFTFYQMFALIHGRKYVTRAYTEGQPAAQPDEDTNDTTPICSTPFESTVSGPPESPLQADRPPDAFRHTFWLWASVKPQLTMHSALVRTGLLVKRSVAEVA
uniref:Uncharacterized protein n=1 Tax=Anopheles merus TaxID=30066 RepID=A0A182UYP6_ANOME